MFFLYISYFYYKTVFDERAQTEDVCIDLYDLKMFVLFHMYDKGKLWIKILSLFIPLNDVFSCNLPA